MRRLAALAVVLAGMAVWAVPWLVRERELRAAVPSPPGLLAIDAVEVAAGASACSADVAVDPRAARAQIGVRALRGTTPPLDLTLRGPGYAADARIAGGLRRDARVRVAIAPPPRAVLVRACVRNAGDRPVALLAAGDRSRSRSLTSVDGRPTGRSAWLSLFEGERHSIASRASATIERIGVFRPAIVGPWLLWPLALLVALGVPAGALWAWDRGLRDDASLARPADGVMGEE